MLVLQEVHGLTFAATPQQNINILTLGAKNGKGGFFPNGEHVLSIVKAFHSVVCFGCLCAGNMYV